MSDSPPRSRSGAPAPIRLDTSVKYLKGIGERRADALARLDIATAHDLLWHLPHRYIDASSVTPIVKLTVGVEAAAVGRVIAKGILPTRKGLRVFHVVLRDQSGAIECVWPGQAFLDRTIVVGQTLLVAGPVRFYHGRQMAPRECIVLAEESDEDGPDPLAAGRVLPVYPATEGLSHKLIRGLIERHLDDLIALSIEMLPDDLRVQFNLPTLPAALKAVHHPTSIAEAERGRRRLALDELVDLQIMLGRARFVAKRGRQGVAFENRRDLTSRLKASLPWALTEDQRRALKEIVGDMTAPDRMHRLLMGDVGTGKTVVALFAMLLAVENDYQAALMAPTELLVEQHHATLTGLLGPLGIAPGLLVGRLGTREKDTVRKQLATGAMRIVVGTHALVQETVTFHRLGLVVIDEQHRFGVEQRAALMSKGSGPDVLLLSATPIPRSLALTRYGDLDLSVIKQRPPGRGPIRTVLREAAQRDKVLDFVAAECRAGRQAYVVLPVIEETEKADLLAAKTMADTLIGRWPDLAVGLVHGKLKSTERDQAMRAFRAGEISVLVATTVIEVGIDVANATIMVIEHPERFGLAQLHQLRGRVGRGGQASHCILISRYPAPRLKVFAATDDGFRIAELDLEERRQGDLLGQRQSGTADIRVARFPDDNYLLATARDLAKAVLDQDPGLDMTRHKALKSRALARYPNAEVLFRVG